MELSSSKLALRRREESRVCVGAAHIVTLEPLVSLLALQKALSEYFCPHEYINDRCNKVAIMLCVVRTHVHAFQMSTWPWWGR